MGLSQLALGTLLGVAPNAIWQWENERRGLTRRTKVQLQLLAKHGYCGKRRKLKARTSKSSKAKALKAVLLAKGVGTLSSEVVTSPTFPPQERNISVNAQLDRIEDMLSYLLADG